jgi:hypothetical protein
VNSKVADFVEAHGRAMVLIVLAFAMSGLFFIFKLPIMGYLLDSGDPKM